MNISWVRDFARAMEPFTTGGFYPNYDDQASGDRIVSAFGPEKYSKLAAVNASMTRRTCSALNQNIRPAEA